jgi:hypothetical protein
MGDQTNPPDRIGLAETRAGIEYVTAASYDRVVAEREQVIRERDEVLSNLGARNGDLWVLQAECDRLREALEFYADRKNYVDSAPGHSSPDGDGGYTWEDDDGLRARAALSAPSVEGDGEIRRLAHDVLEIGMREAEKALAAAEGHAAAPIIGGLLNELHGAWREFDRLGGFDGKPAAGVQSTTETGEDHPTLREQMWSQAVDAVLPAEGERRDELVARMGFAMADPDLLHDLAAKSNVAYDALREAAAPATPEGPDA